MNTIIMLTAVIFALGIFRNTVVGSFFGGLAKAFVCFIIFMILWDLVV